MKVHDRSESVRQAPNPLNPFHKWAGGESRLLSRNLSRLPGRMQTYDEPFLGDVVALTEGRRLTGIEPSGFAIAPVEFHPGARGGWVTGLERCCPRVPIDLLGERLR